MKNASQGVIGSVGLDSSLNGAGNSPYLRQRALEMALEHSRTVGGLNTATIADAAETFYDFIVKEA